MKKLSWLKISLVASIAINIFLVGSQKENLSNIKESLKRGIRNMANAKQDCPGNSLNIVFLGQSNSANRVPDTTSIDNDYIYV